MLEPDVLKNFCEPLLLNYARHYRLVETGRNWGAEAPQILANIDRLPIDNDSQKKKIAKKYKLVHIAQKLLATLLLSIS